MNARDVIAEWLNAFDGYDPRPGTDERYDADDILAALDAAGFQVVPKEPTERMLEAGSTALSDEERDSNLVVSNAHRNDMTKLEKLVAHALRNKTHKIFADEYAQKAAAVHGSGGGVWISNAAMRDMIREILRLKGEDA